MAEQQLKSMMIEHGMATKINKLVLHGFKSFAKRTELLFGDNFNCVLGPNGSGKSNIIDALCFVLGKSSAKALRTEKSANLIYNGGKLKNPAKDAEVSIYFDNTKKVFPTDEKEVKISRVVKQSGQSVYMINDERRTKEQILDLLSLAKVNPDGYNIILQGDIVQFCEMPPEQRRELIEEISGINIYQEKKDKAINELNKVEERLKEAEIILAERETRLRDLQKEREQAMKYKGLKDKIQNHKGSLIHTQMENRAEEKKNLEEKYAKQQGLLAEKRNQIKGMKEKIVSMRSEITRINNEIEEKGEKEQVAVHKEVEHIKVELATSKNRVDSLKEELNRIKTRKDQLQKNLDDVEDTVKSQIKDRDALAAGIKDANKQQAEIDKRLEEFRKKNKLDNIGDVERQIDTLDKEAEEIQKRVQAVRQKQQDLLREKDKLELQINTIDEKIEKVSIIEEENKEKIEELKQKKADFKKATNELAQLVNKDSSISAQIGNARSTLEAYREELAKLSARRISIQETLSSDKALRDILSMKGSNNNIFGTVSELGNVSSKYALALEVAAGQKLKSVVVRDDKTAAELIKQLRQKKLGVVTFLPLNKIKGVTIRQEVAKMVDTTGVHGLAVNLIEYDPKFKDIFSYVFGNTLIVENIDVARRIGIGAAKMATLEGDVAEVSGAMQGGYRQQGKPGLGFGEKEVAQGLEAVEKKRRDTEQLLERLEKDKEEGEAMITQLRQLKANLEGDVITLEKILHLDTDDVDVGRKERQELQGNLKKVEKEIEALTEQVSKSNTDLAQNKTKKQDLRNRINELRNPALLAELNAFEEKKRELRESVIKSEADLKNLEGQIANILEKEKENSLKVMKQHTKEEDEFRTELKNMQQRIQKMEGELKDKEKKEKQFYEQFKDLFTKRTKTDDSIKKLEGHIDELNEQEKKFDHTTNEATLELNQIKTILAELDKEFEQYKDVEIIRNKSEQQLRKDIGIFEGVITKMGNINMRALEIYETAENEYNALLKKKDRLTMEKEDVLIMMNEIELKKKDLFMKTFNVINDNFKRIFSTLSTKGEANLVLESPDLPFEGGLLIKVKLVGTKFMDIRSLSGGEKTMTALAFIFSIQEHEPASFYVLDEVDAALDKHNSQKLADLIKQYADRAQYVMVSHNDSVIASADTLYGISMDEHGTSKVVSLKI